MAQLLLMCTVAIWSDWYKELLIVGDANGDIHFIQVRQSSWSFGFKGAVQLSLLSDLLTV
jgi:hypothetical protein